MKKIKTILLQSALIGATVYGYYFNNLGARYAETLIIILFSAYFFMNAGAMYHILKADSKKIARDLFQRFSMRTTFRAISDFITILICGLLIANAGKESSLVMFVIIAFAFITDFTVRKIHINIFNKMT